MNDDGVAAGANFGNSDTVWPVYKGSSFNLWQPDTGIYYDSAIAERMIRHLQARRLVQRRKRRSPFSEQGQSVTGNPSTLPCLRPRIAFRDVTNPTNTRTLVIALVPGQRVIVHQAPYLLQTSGTNRDEAFLLGVMSSMPCDWQTRRTVELHMTFGQLNQISVPDPGEGDPVRDRVVEIAGRLAAVDERFEEWAAEVGVPVGSVTDDETRQHLLAELDACVGFLYGLDEDDLRVIYGTFSKTRPYTARLHRVLNHFQRLSATESVNRTSSNRSSR